MGDHHLSGDAKVDGSAHLKTKPLLLSAALGSGYPGRGAIPFGIADR